MLSDKDFVTLSLVDGLFYLRTIREFCANIKLAFLSKNQSYVDKAMQFAKRCEELGAILVKYADGNLSKEVLDAEIIVTKYTLPLELLTEKLFGTDINTDITKREMALKPGSISDITEETINVLMEVNKKALELTREFVDYLQDIFQKEKTNELFSYSYPALIKYMIDESNLYANYLERLIRKENIDPTFVTDYEYMFITSMRNIASFLRSLLNPSHEEFYIKAEAFWSEFDNLLTDYKNTSLSPDNQDMLANKALRVVDRFIAYITQCIEGLLNHKLYYIVEPIFLDNMLTEANYFKYILNYDRKIE